MNEEQIGVNAAICSRGKTRCWLRRSYLGCVHTLDAAAPTFSSLRIYLAKTRDGVNGFEMQVQSDFEKCEQHQRVFAKVFLSAVNCFLTSEVVRYRMSPSGR